MKISKILSVRRIAEAAAGVSLLGSPLPAMAFKVETHVWIAQQALNELASTPDSSITIRVGDEDRRFDVDAEVRQAILAHPAYYRMGHIGPDAFPGILEGQMAIHPGVGDWGTGEWLAHFVELAETPEETAFAYGLLGHAAADTWAHSYVNHYTGNRYSLTDGETHVEARHFILEGYIASKAPPIVMPDGQTADSIAALLDSDGQLAIPTKLLLRASLEDRQAVGRLAASGSAHFKAVHDLNGSIDDLTREGGPLEDIHRLVQGAIVLRLTGLEAERSELEKISELHQWWKDTQNDTINDLQRHHDDFRGVMAETRHLHNAAVLGFMEAADGAFAGIRDAEGKIDNLEDEIVDAVGRLERMDPIRRWLNIGTRCVQRDPIFNHCVAHAPRFGWVESDSPAAQELKRLIDRKRSLKADIHRNATRLRADHRSNIGEAFGIVEEIHAKELDALNAVIDLTQRFNSNENPLAEGLLAWKADNLSAMEAYFVANGQAMVNSISGDSVMDPLTDWLGCEALTFIGIPRDGLRAGCAIRDMLAEIDALLDVALAMDPASAELKRNVDALREHILDLALDEGLKFADSINGTSFRSLVAAMTEDATASRLNEQFGEAPEGVALMLIPDMAARADIDMALDTNGRFDPDQFATLANAVTLTKLSLMPPEGLNALMGWPFYDLTGTPEANIMYTLSASIDGDYPWTGSPPPYMRAQGPHADSAPSGYPQGFDMWTDRQSRHELFRKIFKGPINAGLFLAGDTDMADIVPDTYLYRPTSECGFPDTDDHDCITRGMEWYSARRLVFAREPDTGE